MPLRVRVVFDPRDDAATQWMSRLERHAPEDFDVAGVPVGAGTASVPDPLRSGADLVLHRSRHPEACLAVSPDAVQVGRFVQWRPALPSGALGGVAECHVFAARRPPWCVDVPVRVQVPDLDPAVVSDGGAARAYASWFERLRFLDPRGAFTDGASSTSATVVIPLRRQRDTWLDTCVASAVAQGEGVEVVVVTAPDTPASNLAILAARATQAPALRVMAQAPGSGFAGAINTGIRAARGERIALLLSDDWLAEGAIRRSLDEDADIVCAAHAVHDADAATTFWVRRPEGARFDALTSMEERAAYLSHLLVFRRQALLAVGGVDPTVELAGADDFDLPWCLLARGASVALVEDVLYHYRDHAGERLTLRDPVLRARDLTAVFDKHGVVGPLRDARLARHLAWLGAPCHVVAARLGPQSS